MKACAVTNCAAQAVRRGWCTKHYTRFLRHGDPLGGGCGHGVPMQWLRDHVGYSGDECLIWPFATMSNGYGSVRSDGRSRVASRVMCQMAHGQPDHDEQQAAHSCGNGHLGCVNPIHLRWATSVENCADTVQAGNSLRGMRSPHRKLTPAHASIIKELLKAGRSKRQVANDFNVTPGSVAGISKGKAWAWVV